MDYSMDMKLIEKRIQNIQKSNLQSLSQSLWYMDKKYAETQLNGILQLPDIQYLKITSKVKQNNISAGILQTQNILSYEFPLIHRANDRKYDVGVIRIIVNLNNIYQRLFNRVLVILGTQALKTFLVSGFIFIIVQWLITRHLINISNFVQHLNIDNLEQVLQLPQSVEKENELSQVVDAINIMKIDLHRKIGSLKKSEKRYRTLIENAPIVILHLSPTGDILDLNPEAEKLYGRKRQQIVGQNFIDNYLPEEVQDEVYLDIKKVLKGMPTRGFENQFINGKGDKHLMLWDVVRLLDDQNTVTGIIAIGLDITETKRMESQLQQAKKMESIGTLAGGVAHDFNNMLSIILGYADLALEKLTPNEPLYKDIAEIYEAGKRSSEITRQLLAFARKQTTEPKVLDLNDNIESLLKMLRRLIGEDIDLAWRPGADIWLVKFDPSQIDQILANLCVNARDAIEGVGKVTIETRNTTISNEYCSNHPAFAPGKFVLLVVSDTGSGIPPESLDKIFEPFFTTKGLHRGTGLGLSTVYGIVKQNNGFINVYSEMEEGTSIKIYLPRSMGKIVEARYESISSVPLSQGETIILVEDDDSILKLGEKMLSSLGYTVLTANSPSKAIKVADDYTDKIHLLLTDVIMPEMNGRQLSQQITSKYPEMKTLYMSGYTANVIAHRGVLDEGVQFIPKPLSKREMAIKIREILSV